MTTLAKTASLFAAAAILPAATFASVATFTINPAADSYVNNARVSQNNGSAPTFVANNNGGVAGNGVRVAFLRFDLSGIDTGTITNLKLDLTVSTAKALGYSIYGLTNENWTEGDITWANAPGVESGVTAKPSTTSLYLKTGDLYGAGAVLADFTSLAQPGVETVFDVSSGSAMLDFIKADADKSVTFLIVKHDADTSGGGTAWNSREATSGQPVLTITTQVPESSPYGLIGAGAFAVVALSTAGVLVVRRRKPPAPKLPPSPHLPPPPQ